MNNFWWKGDDTHSNIESVALFPSIVEGREGCRAYRGIKNVSKREGWDMARQQLTQTHSSGSREGAQREGGEAPRDVRGGWGRGGEGQEVAKGARPLFNPRLRGALGSHPSRLTGSNWVFRPSHRRIGGIQESLTKTGGLTKPYCFDEKFNLRNAVDKEIQSLTLIEGKRKSKVL